MATSLHDMAPTEENIKRLLGYPDIYVRPGDRERQCPNCGRVGHSKAECQIPGMEPLLERFGPDCYDSSPVAVEAKKKILGGLFS
jgi:hypothetical protein